VLNFVDRRVWGVVLAVGPLVATACSNSLDAEGFSSGSSSGSAMDSGSVDAGADAPDATVTPPPAAVVFLHASPSLQSVRLCFLPQGNSWPAFPADNTMPASNYAGIPVGGAVWLADAGAPIGGSEVYAVRARLIAGATTPCSQLICSGTNCLTENNDFWHVGTLSPDSLRPGATTVVAVSGCENDDDPLASVDRCGSTWNPAMGNLRLDVLTVDSASYGDAGLLNVQAAQLSPGLLSMQGDAGLTTVSFGSNVDAAAAQPIAQLAQEGEVEPAAPVPLSLPGNAAAFGQLGFAVGVTGVDAGSSANLWMSLTEALQLVDPSQDPTRYYAGGQFVVAVLGEPGAPHAFASNGDGVYDGTGLHILVLPLGRNPGH
jgi:hypothetical protein